MSIDDDIAFLERVPTLRLLGRGALRMLAIGAETPLRAWRRSAVQARASGRCAAIVVQEGIVQPQPRIRQITQAAIDAGPGTLLGEVALLTETTAPAHGDRAVEPSTVIRISRSLF